MLPTVRRNGFTLIELLVVVVVIGVLASVALPKLSGTKGRAYAAAMKSDLRNLATAQEAYNADNATYASALGPLSVRASSGVVLTVVSGTPAGWSARATHPGGAPLTCAMYVGGAAPLAPATTEGVAECQ